MLYTLAGILRNGMIELEETPPAPDGARVLVTFLADPSPRQTPLRVEAFDRLVAAAEPDTDAGAGRLDELA